MKFGKRLIALIESAPDRCTICRKEFPHLSHTFSGYTDRHRKSPAIAGHCCKDKLRIVLGGGVYVHSDKPCSQVEYEAAFYSHPFAYLFRKG